MNQNNQSSNLPLGAKGFETENFYIQILPDKIVFGSRLPEKPHFTLAFGKQSRIMDLHKTDKEGNHETIAAIRTDSIPRILNELASPLFISLRKLIRRTSIGWIGHRKIAIVNIIRVRS